MSRTRKAAPALHYSLANRPSNNEERETTMRRLFTILAATLLALPVVACASSTPDQNEGLTVRKTRMSQAEAQKLIDDMNQAGPVCRRAVPDCSYSEPDADGIVVFEALIDCNAEGGCSLLKAGSGCW